MWAYFFRRLGGGLLTLFVIASVAFFITRLTPGSPFSTERMNDPRVLKALDEKFGRDKSPLVQYAIAMWGYVQGDFGPMWKSPGRTVGEYLWPAFRVSVQLGAISAIIAILIGVPFGVIASAGKNRWPDHLAMSGAITGICVPNFLLGPLLVLLLTFAWDLLPPTGWPQSWSVAELSKLIMPAVTLSLVHIAYLSRLTRAGMLDVMNQDYIRTARAKGVSELSVFLRHGLKNGITPALSYSGPMAAAIITGSLVVETVFVVPGLGTHFVKSATTREMPLLMGCVIVYGALVIVFNALVDMFYAVLDPRVRLQ